MVSLILGEFCLLMHPGIVTETRSSSVASAIAQRYIQQILEACLSAPSPLHRVAVDILTSIARSGFSHPLTIAPVLVALTSSSDPQISTKVYATLSLIHSKHATLLATRFAEPVKASYTYAKAVSGANAARGTSPLGRSCFVTVLNYRL